MKEKVFIVISVFNGWQHTHACLDSLRASYYKNIEIIVVDHGSTDETTTALPFYYPEVIHLKESPHLWWAGATNRGIYEALNRGAHFIMLLNNDCTVEYETITHIMKHFHPSEEKVIAPIQKDSYSGRIIGSVTDHCFLLGFPTLILPWKKPGVISSRNLFPTRLILGGRGVVIPSTVFHRAGMLDEHNLPHYGADHDFYLRIKKQGIPLYIDSQAVVKVNSSQTTLAHSVKDMNWAEFYQSLTSRRSHKNIKDLTALFKKHYPVKKLYYVGVSLNLSRYFILFLINRAFRWVRK
jgi:GT2 family glycosyltransferase